MTPEQPLLAPEVAIQAHTGDVSVRTFSQNIIGNWQGTLESGPPGQTIKLRTILKITRADDRGPQGHLVQHRPARP
jgi:hypothetical protein